MNTAHRMAAAMTSRSPITVADEKAMVPEPLPMTRPTPTIVATIPEAATRPTPSCPASLLSNAV